MPPFVSGELTVTAIQDLGGMGANESAPVVCQIDWAPPVWESIPILLLAGLLWAERQRNRANGWIVLALIAGCGAQWLLARFFSFVPGSVMDAFETSFRALVFGNAILWLASAHLANPKRGVTLLATITVLVAASFAMLAASIDLNDFQTAMPASVILLIISAATVASYYAASLCCRNRLEPVRFIALFTFCYLVAIGVILTLLMVLTGGNIGMSICAAICGGFALGAFLGLTPVLLVIFLHPAQRDRLGELFPSH